MSKARASRKPVKRGPRTLLERPLRFAKGLAAVILVVGVVVTFTGILVLLGVIREGWGFPMSAVPNFGRIWGMALIVAGGLNTAAAGWLFVNAQKGAPLLLVVGALNVPFSVPILTTTIEILYNLTREEKIRPVWIDAVWAYFLIVNVALLVALYQALGGGQEDRTATAAAAGQRTS